MISAPMYSRTLLHICSYTGHLDLLEPKTQVRTGEYRRWPRNLQIFVWLAYWQSSRLLNDFSVYFGIVGVRFHKKDFIKLELICLGMVWHRKKIELGVRECRFKSQVFYSLVKDHKVVVLELERNSEII